MGTKKKSELKTLLKHLVDSRKGYEEAAKECGQERHKKLFQELATARQQYALTLQDYLTRYDIDADLEGTMLGSTHRFFMNLKNAIRNTHDEEILESIITGESELLDNYRDALDDADYDTELIKILQDQYRKIDSNLETIHTKKKAA